MYPKAPESELGKDENLLMEAHSSWQMVHIEAYVVHVDMVSQNEVVFKLTPETIEALVGFHEDVYLVDAAASAGDRTDKDARLVELREAFVWATNEFVYRTDAQALEGLEDDGAENCSVSRERMRRRQSPNFSSHCYLHRPKMLIFPAHRPSPT